MKASSSQSQKLGIYAFQTDIVWEDAQANYQLVWRLVEKARPAPRSLIVLPELFAVGFTMNTGKVAEPPEGPTIQFLCRLAKRWRCALLAGAPRRCGSRVFNEAVAIHPSGEVMARYAKTHLFSPGGEGKHYSAGTTLQTFKWRDVHIAPFVCYDLRFPELFRAAARKGAELLVVIANWPARRDTHWRTLLQARAIENQAYVLGVNRTGSDPNIEYNGNTLLFDPKGSLIAWAGSGEAVMKGHVDKKVCGQWRREFPVLADCRPGLRIVLSD